MVVGTLLPVGSRDLAGSHILLQDSPPDSQQREHRILEVRPHHTHQQQAGRDLQLAVAFRTAAAVVALHTCLQQGVAGAFCAAGEEP